MEVLKPKPIDAKKESSSTGMRLVRDLYIWGKYTLIFAGAFSVVMFIRVNFLEEVLTFNTAEIPLIVVPNAKVVSPKR